MMVPNNILKIGTIKLDDAQVFIKQNVHKALEDYARVDVNNERGTILVGDYEEKNGIFYIVISDFIEAKYTEYTATSLTFTHDTWNYVNETFEKEFSDKRIIGWQHTHPGLGVFLSNFDMFIQENFFDLPFQVAYVIDPVNNHRGFFQWKNGKVEKLKGYYLYDDDGIEINKRKRI